MLTSFPLLLSVALSAPAPAPAAGQNRAPVAPSLALQLDEDARGEGQVAATDADGDTLKYRLAAKAKHGEVTLDALTGAFSYVPAKNFHGDDAFSVDASDGKLKATAAVTLKVKPVNDAPEAKPLALTTAEDAPARGKVSASDVDGDTLTYAVKTAPGRGQATIDSKTGAVTFVPAQDANGEETFVVEVSDGALQASSDVKVTVTPVNDGPVATALGVDADEDARKEGQVTASDVDGDTLTYRLAAKAKRGEVTVDEKTGAVSYTPGTNFHGDDAFSVDVSDGKLKATAAVTVKVKAVNDAPEAKPLALSTAEDAPVRGKVVASDVDGDTLTYSVKAQPGRGQATVDSKSGAVTFVPAQDANGEDSFVVEVSDGALQAAAEVKVSVTAVNDGPVAAALALEADEDTRKAGQVVASDVDGDALTYRLATKAARGEATVDEKSGAVSYTPGKDFHGDDAFTMDVSDGKLKATAAVTVKVKAVNDAPVAKPLALSTAEDAPVRGKVVASDVDGDVLTYSVKTQAARGQATVDAKTGAVTFVPAQDANGEDAFVVEVSDGALQASSEVKVSVVAVNDAPVAPAFTLEVDEDTRTESQVAASDVDGDPLTWRLVTKPKHGEVTVDEKSGAVGFTPAKDFHGDDAFTVDVSDGKLKVTSAVTVKIKALNDAPVAKPLSLSTVEDTPVRGKVVASDVDGDTLTYTVKTPPSRGQATVDAKTGAVTFVPAQDANGAEAFVVEVSDGALQATSEVTLTVSAVQDPPVARPFTLTLAEDTVGESTLPGADPDGDPITFKLTALPRQGVAALLTPATGAFRYTPALNFNGDDELAFEVTDGKATAKGTVKLRVSPVNDPPTLAALDLATLEDRPVDGQLAGRDLDGDALTYSIVTQAKKGKAVILDAAQGRLRFEPARDQNGPMSFTAVVSDGKLTSEPVTVKVEVEPQNDAPVAASARVSTEEDTPVTGTLAATDADGDPRVFKLERPPAHGTATITDAAKGSFAYVPADDSFGADEFTFSATDPSLASSQGTVSVAISAVDDPPIADAISLSAPFRGTTTATLHGFDKERKPVTYRLVDQPSGYHIKLVNPKTGEILITTNGSESGRLVFTFVVSDGTLTSEPAEGVVQIRNL